MTSRGKERRLVDLENVGLHYFYVAHPTNHVSKYRDQAPIELDGDQPAAALSQGHSQRPGSRADLEHLVPARDAGGVGDAVSNGRVDHEVLAERMLGVDAVAAEKSEELVRVCRVDHVIFEKRANALARSISASSSTLIPRSSATRLAVSSR